MKGRFNFTIETELMEWFKANSVKNKEKMSPLVEKFITEFSASCALSGSTNGKI